MNEATSGSSSTSSRWAVVSMFTCGRLVSNKHLTRYSHIKIRRLPFRVDSQCVLVSPELWRSTPDVLRVERNSQRVPFLRDRQWPQVGLHFFRWSPISPNRRPKGGTLIVGRRRGIRFENAPVRLVMGTIRTKGAVLDLSGLVNDDDLSICDPKRVGRICKRRKSRQIDE